MKLLFNYLIFPGFLFTACAGLLAGWVDRKLTARIQWRQGPPWYQNFADFAKLLGKEIIVPKSGKYLFLLAPLLGLASVTLIAMILGGAIINAQSFIGDIIVLIYLLIIPALAVIIGASSSANPLASVGVSREIKLILGYELPFILAIAVVIIKSGGAIRTNDILMHQSGGSICFSFP
jgi:NADH-quinone oxidoreductase subunit H